MKSLYLLLLALLVACSGNIISVPSVESTNAPQGYTAYTEYYLPKTALKIQIPISHNTLKKSIVTTDTDKVHKVLLDYFNWEPVEEPKDAFTLDQKIIFQPLTLRDPNKRFVIAYKKSKGVAETLNLSFSKDGLIQSGEFAQENKAFDITKKGLELVASTIGALAGLGPNASDKFETDISGISSLRIKSLLRKVYDLSKARYELVKQMGTSVNSPEILKTHLGEIDDQVKTIKALLTGAVKKDIYYMTLLVEPSKDFKDITLLTLNPKNGVVSKQGDAWSVLSEELIKGTADGAKVLKLTASKLFGESAALGKPVSSNPVPSTTSAFLYYNIPAKYELTLLFGNERVASYGTKDQKEGTDDYQIYFPQLGRLAYLPSDFKEANVVYYEDIGSLKTAKHVKTATVTPEAVEGMYKALDSLRTTFKAIKDKQSDNDDEEVEEEVNEQVIRLIIENVASPAGN